MLFSILLLMCFGFMGWQRFDLLFLEIPWPPVFVLIGAAGLGMAFWPERKE